MIVQFEVRPLDVMTGNQCISVKKTLGWSAVLWCKGEFILLCETIFCCVLSGGNCA